MDAVRAAGYAYACAIDPGDLNGPHALPASTSARTTPPYASSSSTGCTACAAARWRASHEGAAHHHRARCRRCGAATAAAGAPLARRVRCRDAHQPGRGRRRPDRRRGARLPSRHDRQPRPRRPPPPGPPHPHGPLRPRPHPPLPRLRLRPARRPDRGREGGRRHRTLPGRLADGGPRPQRRGPRPVPRQRAAGPLHGRRLPTVAERLKRWGVPGPRIEVVPNGIDLARFRFDPVQRLRTRQRLGLPEGAYVIGGIGRLAAGKRFDVLVRALAQLPDDYWLLLVGGGTEENLLRRTAHDYRVADRVLFTGERPYVPDGTPAPTCPPSPPRWTSSPRRPRGGLRPGGRRRSGVRAARALRVLPRHRGPPRRPRPPPAGCRAAPRSSPARWRRPRAGPASAHRPGRRPPLLHHPQRRPPHGRVRGGLHLVAVPVPQGVSSS